MKIIHFDVDAELDKYLNGEKYSYSLDEITSPEKFSQTDIITIKSIANAHKEQLSIFPNLKALITRTVGTDHIDLEYCKQKGIEVFNILDYGSFNIAEHVFALLLAGTRNILNSQHEIKSGIFSYNNHLGIALKGKTMGIVGTGKIGLETIKRAKGFEMNVVAYDVFKNEKAAKELEFLYISLEELATSADIISLHAPLLESTKHMINDRILERMKPGAILINTARGGLIDTNALVNHIKKFRWVGLDVLENEKEFSKDHPLLQFGNVVITPHIAFFSDASTKRIAEVTVEHIKNFKQGKKENRVV
jgi:D-lactate dehydrogenase